MRELKFRIWDAKNKKWLENCSTNHGEIYYAVADNQVFCFEYNVETGERSSGAIEDCVIQQYTELKDKNGVEIYEGDVLKWKENQYSKVIFKFGGFWVNGINFIANDILYEWIDSYEVIGNIFENEDLL